MSFEVKYKDLLGRVGKLETSHGVVETPMVAPVINPLKLVVEPEEMYKMGFQIVMTNAFIIKKNYGDLGVELGVHGILGVNGPVMTDSGAYQILEYGEIDVGPEEILRYQEEIGSDIGVILDIPTKYGSTFEEAREGVEETLKRAREALAKRRRSDFLLVGPVQGGRHYELVRYAAKELSSMPFDIYAIGSPTPLMEQYKFEELVDLIMAAKRHLPLDKPVHLFGAGHPLMLSLAVALGVDLFDSASYALYARDHRYMTPFGTYRLEELEELPCCCPICSKLGVEGLKSLSEEERVKCLALHNLYVLIGEIRTIKQAIKEGRLWELLEVKASAHPSIKKALKVLRKYKEFLERHDPVIPSKIRGLVFSSPLSIYRPEVVRYRSRLLSRFSPPPGSRVLLLIPGTDEKPFHETEGVSRLRASVGNDVHICVYTYPFGLVPLELDDIYPLSQHETSLPVAGFKAPVLNTVTRYLEAFGRGYKALVIYGDRRTWGRAFYDRLVSTAHSMGLKVKVVFSRGALYSEEEVREVLSALKGLRNTYI